MEPAQQPAQPDPGSLTWRYFGDVRVLLVAQRAGVLQLMHPAIGAAIAAQSDTFEDPLGRLVRSARPIGEVIFGADPNAVATWVRDQHTAIRSPAGAHRHYQALHPETYYWAHATFFEGQIAAQELFGRSLSRSEKERLYEESIAWYARYGVSMRPVPADYGAFEEYWDHTLETVLAPTPEALRVTGRLMPLPTGRRFLAAPLSQQLALPLYTVAGPWLARCTLPPVAADMLDIELSSAERLAFKTLQRVVRRTVPKLPNRLARLPLAHAADLRVGS